MPPFVPQHLNADAGDFEGNGELGRIVLLPGSPGRAERVAAQLGQVTVKRHSRGHHVFLGTLAAPSSETGALSDARAVDLAVVPTGMGCPSTEIIVTELIELGARQLLRIGTCGALQRWVKVGDLVVASAAVRDESTTSDLLPKEFPALASLNWVLALQRAAQALVPSPRTHVGCVHTKASLYAREFARGPLASEHERYKLLLERAGVLASEMEASALFVLATLGRSGADVEPRVAVEPRTAVEAGALLAVVGDVNHGFSTPEKIEQSESDLITLALAAARERALII